MLHIRLLLLTCSCTLVLALVTTTAAQEATAVAPSQTESSTVTAAATAERVRFAAPNAVVQMRLEVYNDSGQKMLDTEQRGGSVLDWHLQSGAGERVAEGEYLCVLTVKSLSGRLSQKLGTVTVGSQTAAVQSTPAAQLKGAQAQAVGPVGTDTALVVLSVDSDQAATILTHNGKEGELSRTRGALTFGVGDFFSGNDKEQMRLTEEGNLGIGTAKPKVKLDVAGTVRAREGFAFADGSKLNVNDKGALTLTNSNGTIAPNVAGTGTQDRLAKWAETGGAGTLTDSTITEVGGRVGIGVSSPTYKLVVGPDIGPGLTTADLTVSRGAGQSVSAFVGASGSNGMNFGWDQGNQRAFVNAPVQSPITFTHGGVNERMRITTNGNVGIGTTNPSAKLDVAGDINTSTQYLIRGNPALSVTGAGSFLNSNTFAGAGAGASNTPSGTTVNGNNNSFFGSNAGEANTNGFGNSLFGRQAGFGNTLGFGNSFFGDLAGNATATGDNNSFFGRSVGLTNISGGQDSLFGAFADSADGLTNATAIGFRAFVGQSNSLVLGGITGVNSGTDTNVGIGTTTPQSLLHVDGDVRVSGTGHGFIFPDGTKQTTSASASVGGSGTSDKVALWTGSKTLGNSSMTQSGLNIGIGTATIAAKLHVADNSGQILMGGAGCTAGFAGIGFADTMSGCNNYSLLGDGNDTIINSPQNGKISFRQNNSERAAILANGNVGIGVTNPTAKLQVVGGDIFVSTQGRGLILKSPIGECFVLAVDVQGQLFASGVPCP